MMLLRCSRMASARTVAKQLQAAPDTDAYIFPLIGYQAHSPRRLQQEARAYEKALAKL